MTETNSSLLQLFNLEGNFENTLIEYKKEYANYTSSLENSSAVDAKSSLTNLDLLNSKLLNTNQEILNQMKSIKIDGTSLNSDIITRLDSLKNSYNELLFEREKIQSLQNEYNTISTENKSQTMNINHQYARYLFWLFIALVVGFLTIRLVFFPSEPIDVGKFYFWAFVGSALFISISYSYHPSGFTIAGLIAAYLILGFMKIVPMP
jgi:hypothetical protein